MKSVLLAEADVRKIMLGASSLSDRDNLIMQLCYYCAMSPSEVIHLKADSFDRETGKLSVISTYGVRGPVWFSQVPRNVVPSLEIHVGGRREGWMFESHGRSCDLAGCTGGHISRRHIQNVFLSILETCNVDRCGVLSLRHTRLCEIGKITKDPGMVQEIGRILSTRLCKKYAEAHAE